MGGIRNGEYAALDQRLSRNDLVSLLRSELGYYAYCESVFQQRRPEFDKLTAKAAKTERALNSKSRIVWGIILTVLICAAMACASTVAGRPGVRNPSWETLQAMGWKSDDLIALLIVDYAYFIPKKAVLSALGYGGSIPYDFSAACTFMVFASAATIALIWALVRLRERSLRKKLSKLIVERDASWANCCSAYDPNHVAVVPPRYANAASLGAIVGYLENGRANTWTEAANVLENDERLGRIAQSAMRSEALSSEALKRARNAELEAKRAVSIASWR